MSILIKSESYYYVKILNQLVETLIDVRLHGRRTAGKSRHPLSIKMYNELEEDLEKHIHKLKATIAGLSKEGKF